MIGTYIFPVLVDFQRAGVFPMNKNFIETFMERESSVGVLLMIATVSALLAANSALVGLYDAFLSFPIAVEIGSLSLHKPALLWINDGLMALFFLMVGLELKREILVGELSRISVAILPALAALGGMIVPAAIYLAVTGGDAALARGWAIPVATDIAFALGVMALLGKRVPASLRVFLLALAIIDDLGAIVVIAVFYTDHVVWSALAVAGAAGAGLLALNLSGVRRITPYALIGLVLWVAVLKSGVHATLAGVVLALAIPLGREEGADDPLDRVETALHPWVSFGVIPLFALANAGVSLAGVGPAEVFAPLPLGIALGLFLGKQIGVFGTVLLGARLLGTGLPAGANLAQVYGMAVLTGFGFTMSLFIGMLAFPDPEHAVAIRVGVIGGSVLSAVVGWLILRLAARD